MASSSTNICSGCRQEIPNREYLTCATCKGKYDLACLNMSIKRFLLLDQDRKKNWVCSECRSKLPKMDNSNTPVRTAVHTDDRTYIPAGVNQTQSQSSYVTTRAKQQRPSSDCANCISEEALRSILNQEMNRILDKKIKDLVSRELSCINQQIAGFNESMSFFNKQFEEIKSSLEEKNTQLSILQTENTFLQTTVR